MPSWRIECEDCDQLQNMPDIRGYMQKYCGELGQYLVGKKAAMCSKSQSGITRPTSLMPQCVGCMRADKKKDECVALTEPAAVWAKGACWAKVGEVAIYLGGSIHGYATLAEPMVWRGMAEKRLTKAGYKVYNPLREPIGTTATSVITRDLKDLDATHVYLCEMTMPDKAYIGTGMEIRYAWERGIDIVVWGKENTKSYWMQYHETRRFYFLEAALEHLENEIEVYRQRLIRPREKRDKSGQGSIQVGARNSE